MPDQLQRYVEASKVAGESALEILERNTVARLIATDSYKEMISRLREIKGDADKLALIIAAAGARFKELDTSIRAHIDSENAARKSAAESVKSAEFIAAAPNVHEAKAGEFHKMVSDEKEAIRKEVISGILGYNKRIRELRSWRHDDAIKSFVLSKIGVPGGDDLPPEIDLDATGWKTTA